MIPCCYPVTPQLAQLGNPAMIVLLLINIGNEFWGKVCLGGMMAMEDWTRADH